MNKLFYVFKNEFIRYFLSPLAYIYLITFLVLNGSFAIYFGHFIERENADLSAMFAFHPWLYLLFISSISMRLWSEEFRTKTIVQIMTLPVSTPIFVWGKFFASLMFCALALSLTFPFVITVNVLGNPDNSVIFLAYIGSLLIAGCMLAISQTMSALSKNQVIALVLAVIANMIFFLSGMEYILSVLRPIVPSYIVDMISSFSFLTHMNTIMSGIIELRDIVFFVSIIWLFNFMTIMIIDFKTSEVSNLLKSDNRKSYIVLVMAFLFTFIGINLLANNTLRRYQYDFTEEKIYTLDKNTLEILRNLHNTVTVKLYYSPILGKNDYNMLEAFDRIKVLLSKYKAIAKDKFDYKIYTPAPFDKIEDIALGEGIEPLPSAISNTNALFGMTFTNDIGAKRVIPFLAPERMPFFEYDLSENIYLLSHKKTNLGIITSLPVLGEVNEDNMILDKWEIINQLEKFYNVKSIKNSDDFKGIDLLMIVYPKNLDEKLIAKIKDFTHNGGKTLLFLDVAPEATRLISAVNKNLEASDSTELEKIFGFKFYNEYVTADFKNSILVNASHNYKTNTNFTNDVIQFILKEKEFNPKAQETSNLKKIMLSSAGVIMPASDDVNFEVLIKASDDSAILPASVVYKNTNPADILRFYEKDDNSKILAAKISSKHKTTPFEAIVVTDTDMLYDSFWTKVHHLANSKFLVPILDNANFVLNALESLSGRQYLSSLRGKSAKNRQFSQIEKIRRENKLQYSKNELKILDDISKVKQKLQNIWERKDFENRETFSKDDLSTIKNVRIKLDAERQNLGKLRQKINFDLDEIYSKIKFYNIYFVAGILSLLAFIQLYSKRYKMPVNANQNTIFEKKLLTICFVSVLLFVCGILSVYHFLGSDIDTYENKPVFATLPSKINDVTSIDIYNNTSSVKLSLQDNKWSIKEYPDFMVSQEQVRSFLSAMIEALYYEKKSNRIEDLQQFNLLPLEDKTSQATQIILRDASDNKIADFLLGKYDMDLGRGLKSAYIRFPENFQIWHIIADFIDVSSNWKDWVISSVWDLKIGRFQTIDGNYTTEALADIMKVLLNSEIYEAENDLKNPRELKFLKLKDENDNLVYLYFYVADNKYYVKYKFVPPVNGYYAQILAKNSENKYYRFDKENWDLLNYVLKKHSTK